jgi:hypothetical protein
MACRKRKPITTAVAVTSPLNTRFYCFREEATSVLLAVRVQKGHRREITVPYNVRERRKVRAA